MTVAGPKTAKERRQKADALKRENGMRRVSVFLQKWVVEAVDARRQALSRDAMIDHLLSQIMIEADRQGLTEKQLVLSKVKLEAPPKE